MECSADLYKPGNPLKRKSDFPSPNVKRFCGSTVCILSKHKEQIAKVNCSFLSFYPEWIPKLQKPTLQFEEPPLFVSKTVEWYYTGTFRWTYIPSAHDDLTVIKNGLSQNLKLAKALHSFAKRHQFNSFTQHLTNLCEVVFKVQQLVARTATFAFQIPDFLNLKISPPDFSGHPAIFNDLHLQIGNEPFTANRSLLEVRSLYFRELLRENPQEHTVDDPLIVPLAISPETLRIWLSDIVKGQNLSPLIGSGGTRWLHALENAQEFIQVAKVEKDLKNQKLSLIVDQKTDLVQFVDWLKSYGPLLRGLKFQTEVDPRCLSEIFQSCPHLEKLDMEPADDFSVILAAQSCPHVKAIRLSGSVTNRALVEFSQRWPHLEKLDINNCPEISDGGIKPLARACLNLRKLHLQNCLQITAWSIELVAANSSVLHSLSLKGCINIHPHTIAFLIQRCKELEELFLDKILLKDSPVIGVMLLPSRKLRKLSLADCQLEEWQIEQLVKHCHTLRTLHLNVNAENNEDGVFIDGLLFHNPLLFIT